MAESVWKDLQLRTGETAPRVLICFRVPVRDNFNSDEVRKLLAQQGYVRILHEEEDAIEVIQDRLRLTPDKRGRASDADRQWILEGEGEWDDGVWYGIRRFFDWLKGRAYKMHVRVLLSRYRACWW